jgi:hypothetical protein
VKLKMTTLGEEERGIIFSMQENMEMFVEVVALFNGHVGNNISLKI